MGAAVTHRQCTIEISNHSSYTLCEPSVHIYSGQCDTPLPASLRPSEAGSALFAKTSHTACGAVGVFTYNLHNEDTQQTVKKIAVLFSNPFDFSYYSNWHAVGVFGKDTCCDQSLYDEMYNRPQKGFVRSRASGPSLLYKEGDLTITSTMADTNHAVLKVQVKNSCNESVPLVEKRAARSCCSRCCGFRCFRAESDEDTESRTRAEH